MASIESMFENIYHKKTKKYFEEVLDSYTTGNYRSAVVMLYSVVVCDLVYKLQELNEKYDDDVAKDILQYIKEEQNKNSTSSQWEQKLIDSVFAKSNLLDNVVVENIRHLKKHRHLSAHPVLDELDILFMPTKENARSHIRNMLEGLLVKSPIFSNDIFDFFMEDISENQNYFPDNEDGKLENYLNTKFFKHFNENLEEKIFKALWKFVFKKENGEGDEIERNRDINFRVLGIMFKRNRINLRSLIKENTSYYSRISPSDETIEKMVNFLAVFDDVFILLEDHVQQLLIGKINSKRGLKTISHFLSETPVEHFKKLSKDIHNYNPIDYSSYSLKYTLTSNQIKVLGWVSSNHNCSEEFFDFIIEHHCYSGSFNEADTTFSLCIAPYLEKFNKYHFKKLLQGINDNNQLYNRSAARNDNTHIKLSADIKLGKDFDYSQYEKFDYND